MRFVCVCVCLSVCAHLAGSYFIPDTAPMPSALKGQSIPSIHPTSSCSSLCFHASTYHCLTPHSLHLFICLLVVSPAQDQLHTSRGRIVSVVCYIP